MGFIKIWVLQLFNPYIYIYIFSCAAPLLQRNHWAHKKMSWRKPTKHRTVSSEKIWRKAFSWFFFSQDQIFLFSVLLGKAMVLMPFVDQVVVMMLERGKKKDKWRKNLKFLWKLETDAGGRKRYGLFSPWIFYLPSVSHPNKNGRQQEMLKLERSLSHQKPPGTAMNLHQSTKNHL